MSLSLCCGGGLMRATTRTGIISNTDGIVCKKCRFFTKFALNRCLFTSVSSATAPA